MGLNLGLPAIPKFDQSLLPWLRMLVVRLDSAFQNVDKIDPSTYSPVWTQNGAVTYSTVTIDTRYTRDGVYAEGDILLVCTASAAVGNNIMQITTPVAPISSVGQCVGSGYWYGAAPNLRYPFYVVLIGGVFQFIDVNPGIGVLMGQTGSARNAAVAVGDSINFNYRYRVS